MGDLARQGAWAEDRVTPKYNLDYSKVALFEYYCVTMSTG
jgi:hypothetical protein